jgi:Tol biopolymer transport system component
MLRNARRQASAAIILLAILAACTGAPSPSVSTPGPSDSASQGAKASPGAATASPTAEPTPADATAAAGLALIRPVDGVGQVFVIDPDGTARQVTGFGENASFHAVRPFWSPDRSQIAFRPRGIGAGVDPQLWLVNADGSDQRPIADVGESIGWSPDSSKLLFQDSVYTTDTTGEAARIWLVEVATAELTMLGSGDLPQWLPDGEHFSYVPVRTGPQGGSTFPIVVVPLSGGEPTEVAEAQGAWWSPDGTALLLQQEDGLYLADPDGSNARHLVDGGTPVWSPDGSHLVYAYDHTADALPIIGVVDRDGQVIWSGAVGGDPSWSPDGTKLAVEVGYPETSIQILDAGNGRVIWELGGEDPAW